MLIKLKKIRRVGHVARMEIRKMHTKLHDENLKRKDHLQDVGIDGSEGQVKLSLCLIS
jgi:hypothetical protein